MDRSLLVRADFSDAQMDSAEMGLTKGSTVARFPPKGAAIRPGGGRNSTTAAPRALEKKNGKAYRAQSRTRPLRNSRWLEAQEKRSAATEPTGANALPLGERRRGGTSDPPSASPSAARDNVEQAAEAGGRRAACTGALRRGTTGAG